MPKMIGYQEQINGLVLLSEDTDGGATVEFDIPPGYASVEWHFYNMHPASEDGDNRQFMFQVNAVGESGFNETMTSTSIDMYHSESDSSTSLGYNGSRDQAQGTSYQQLIYGLGADNDQSCSGVLTIYDPSSTTYVKHFMSTVNSSYFSDAAMINMVGGYINTTGAIDEIEFKMSSGNIDSGIIRMYGVR